MEMIDPVPRNLSKVECIAFCMVGLQKKIFPEDLKFYFNQHDEFSVEDGCLLRGSRLVIPAKYQLSPLPDYMFGGRAWTKTSSKQFVIVLTVKEIGSRVLSKSAILGFGPAVRGRGFMLTLPVL